MAKHRDMHEELYCSSELPTDIDRVCSQSDTCEPYLKDILDPSALQSMTVLELEFLAKDIRQYLINTVAVTGGHLAPSLGVIELTLAMLSVFNPASDKLLWDVGHQAYAYKLLTGRYDRFHTLRQHSGISGFPSRDESPYDHFGVGHASTSISAALGMAAARDICGQNHHVVSVIGDGSLTGGLAYEGFNHAGAKERPFIVILNDNEMSISKNVGALSLFMSRNLSSRWVRRVKREVEDFLKNVPGIGHDLVEIARRSKHSFKNFFTPGILFEALHFNYIGAVDGHNIEELQKVLRLAASLDKPVLVHVLTQKGRGYEPAEKNPELFHGIGSFEPRTGFSVAQKSSKESYTEVFSKKLVELAEKDKRIVAITAAMPQGTGLSEFSKRFPHRFYDVGISEQHAVTFAAGLATQGLRPFVAIYSTFLQRAYDMIVHDVCLQNLPVVFCIDRAGIVGEDGATHQGAFDIAYLRHIPNIALFAPKDQAELTLGLETALSHDGPFAIRYPRSTGIEIIDYATKETSISMGSGEFLLQANGGLAVIAIGSMVSPAFIAAQELSAKGHAITVFNARFIKPLPEDSLKEIIKKYDTILIAEEHSLAGGFSSAILEYWADKGLLQGQRIQRLGFPDHFVSHGAAEVVRANLGFDKEGIKKTMLSMLP